MAIFLDASYIIALFSDEDVHHKKAVELSVDIDDQKYGEAFTSDDIVDEVASVIRRKFGKEKAVYTIKEISRRVPIVVCDRQIFEAGMKHFELTQLQLSFTDCMVLSILQVTGTQHIATFDKEFKKVGVTVVD